MKHAFLILLTSVVALTEMHAQKLEALQIARYTRQGADGVLVETGFLAVTTKRFENSGGALYPEDSLGLPASSLTAINGKFVALKATTDAQMEIKGFLDNYSFSKKAYPVVGGDAYIVTFASGQDASAPTASMKVTKSKLKEGQKAKSKIKVRLNKPAPTDLVIRYKLSGSAKYNSDFRISGTKYLVKIKEGKKGGASTIFVIDDKVKEKTEKLKITMQAGSNYKLGKKKKASVKIADNDK